MLAHPHTPVSLDSAPQPTARSQLLVFFFFDGDGIEILGFKDLTAIQAFDIIHAVASRDDHGAGVLASGLHKPIWDLF